MTLISPKTRVGVPPLLSLVPILAAVACSSTASRDVVALDDSSATGTTGNAATTDGASATTGRATDGASGASTSGSGGSATSNGSTTSDAVVTNGTTGSTTGSGGDATTAGSTTGNFGGASSSTDAGAGGASATTGAGGTGSNSGPVIHVFMLMGQSNMAGVAPNEAGDQNTDERLQVLGGCNQPAGQWNLANPPLNDCPGEKGWNLSDSVGPGMWFAKTIVDSLPEGDTIGLVGTAESGESINTFISGGSHHQMILNKIDTVKQTANARFAGVIFHQGESDSGQSTWPGKVVQLYEEVKAAFGVDYDVPFILGELPQGGCCGGHNSLVHQAADQLPMGYWVSQEGTNVMDEYHFDHASVILMGQRYGETMLDALGW